ncbi:MULTISPECIES: hypothetical protein [Burkholderia cepacia complex]|uniref:hypothetical protein n=1 Tax=Burkholderia cepacia complex TaxID=87882 RepID=UPI000CFF8C03|nr:MULTISPECIES: hypothetical protein [Burkholderia cepacia complex]MBR8300923.1 hypothetical protein [Burkholderia dolosa]MBU9208065.1 hypothetical protein [Burkholderia multivorans]MBU9651478.1 hypothetical protein [Burkholderia multivorans]MCO1381255.1 hypothetical protein [Burkholderia multivorans]MCO1401368.1 hypothetical protein [Burkholderia multivorans]
METPLNYAQITACAEREIQHHLTEAASRQRGSHAADIHLGAAIGAFDLWRCLMVELNVGDDDASYAFDAQRLEALVRLAALSCPLQSSDKTGSGNTEPA